MGNKDRCPERKSQEEGEYHHAIGVLHSEEVSRAQAAALTITLRDLTWGLSRFLFPDDHKYYKENGLYDFPYKDLKTIRPIILLKTLDKIPGFRE